MREYQNANYRSIYTEPIAVPGIGDCWLMVFTEPTNENDSSRPEDETWTALFLVSSCLETADTIKDCLEATVGYKGEPTPEEAAIARTLREETLLEVMYELPSHPEWQTWQVTGEHIRRRRHGKEVQAAA